MLSPKGKLVITLTLVWCECGISTVGQSWTVRWFLYECLQQTVWLIMCVTSREQTVWSWLYVRICTGFTGILCQITLCSLASSSFFLLILPFSQISYFTLVCPVMLLLTEKMSEVVIYWNDPWPSVDKRTGLCCSSGWAQKWACSLSSCWENTCVLSRVRGINLPELCGPSCWVEMSPVYAEKGDQIFVDPESEHLSAWLTLCDFSMFTVSRLGCWRFYCLDVCGPFSPSTVSHCVV